ncbi:hypothetical protein PDUR_25790 [Paenibacillus durus]|uniref:Uncharacterized protein n=1 Tax=Paenibacillus durus TaxID=44251 RepID=A0A089J164_PAEDU|nr:hypothetical protein PDUR_25790 [Paenibacillus durus]
MVNFQLKTPLHPLLKPPLKPSLSGWVILKRHIVHPYELQIREVLDKVLPDAYDSIENFEKSPLEIGMSLLKILIEYACKGQNIAVITLARDRIKKIPLKWLTQLKGRHKPFLTIIEFDEKL